MTKKTILITGGSRGIGAEIAKLSATLGFSPIISYLNDFEAAKRVTEEIKSRGGECHVIQTDVGKEEDIVKLFSFIKDRFGSLDCLVNNAGIIEKQTTVSQMTLDRLQRNFNINVIGPFLCAREAIHLMQENGGCIVNISSVASRLGSPNEFVDYAAAKGAIDTFTVGLSKELALKNIRVNTVRPGLIYTDLHASCGDPDRVNKLKQNIPMGRGGTTLEVAKAVLWLCSNESSYVTGATIDVSGGR